MSDMTDHPSSQAQAKVALPPPDLDMMTSIYEGPIYFPSTVEAAIHAAITQDRAARAQAEPVATIEHTVGGALRTGSLQAGWNLPQGVEFKLYLGVTDTGASHD